MLFLTLSCGKDNIIVIDNYSCNDLKTVDNWTTINFKTGYSIQVPPEYKGGGMMGFEGNTFFKFSSDTTIIFEYGYCNGLFCFDFGDTLQNPIPAKVNVKDNSTNLYTLDKILKFCQNAEPIGLLYYSDDNTVNSKLYWNARLYWKDNGLFKQAMMIKFTFMIDFKIPIKKCQNEK
jgi:hypothetical protein